MKPATPFTEAGTRVFKESFTVMEIASGLASFDAEAPADKVKAVMQQRKYFLAGIREQGIMIGYVIGKELKSGSCGDFVHPFNEEMILEPSASFALVIKTLDKTERAFIQILGQVMGIVTRTDLQKHPVRMWLFGIITLMEMALEKIIKTHYPGNSWTELVSEGRLAKAKNLLAERRRRRQEADLVSCLQLSDKGQLLMKNPEIREYLEIPSRKEGNQRIKMIEALRNNLAHSQDIVTHDWATIVRISENLENMLDKIKVL
ncbi:MAG: hypothetical protein ACYTG7_25425 [Planctomycetota bacterium]|jgi:hypothetical protein